MDKTINKRITNIYEKHLYGKVDKKIMIYKLKSLYSSNKEELEKYTKVLYAQARLIEGLTIENPTEISNIMCAIMSK